MRQARSTWTIQSEMRLARRQVVGGPPGARRTTRFARTRTSHGRSGHGPGRANTNRRDQAAPWARRTPSGRAGCRPRSRSPRIGATPGRGPSSPPAVGAESAGGPPPPARSRARRRPGVVGVAASEAHSDAADQAIHESPDPPEYVRIRPTRIAAEALDLGEHPLRRRGDDPPPTLDDHPLAGGHRREARPIRPGERVEPGRLDVVAVGSSIARPSASA